MTPTGVGGVAGWGVVHQFCVLNGFHNLLFLHCHRKCDTDASRARSGTETVDGMSHEDVSVCSAVPPPPITVSSPSSQSGFSRRLQFHIELEEICLI